MSEVEELTLNATDARVLIERIRVHATAALDAMTEAWHGRAWVALGYDSWDHLCKEEFVGLQLPRDERQALHRDLRDEGMSMRAIAATTGAHFTTVANDLMGVENSTPDPPTTITGIDGKSYQSKRPKESTTRLDQIRALAADGVSTAAISETLGITANRVSALAKTAGIPLGKKSRLARAQRIERTRTLAAQGATSQQIAAELDVDQDTIRTYVETFGIDVPADAVTRVRKLDSVRIVTAAIDALDGIDVMFDHIDYAALPADDVDGWVAILDASVKSLTTLRKRLKEITQP